MANRQISCLSCGTGNPEGNKFCTSCGSKLGISAPPPPPTPSPSPTPPTPLEPRPQVAGDGDPVTWPLAIAAMVVLALSVIGVGYVTAVLFGGDPLFSRSSELSQTATAGGQAEGPTPQVICADSVSPVEVSLQTKPDECIILSEGASDDPAGNEFSDFYELEWTSWGPDRAIATGFFFQMGKNEAVFELSDPQVVCGKVVFTRFRTIQAGYTPTLPSPIASCIDR